MKSRSATGEPVARLNTLLVCGAVLILLAMAGLAWLEWRQYRVARSTRILTSEIQASVDGLLASLLDAETGERGFLLTGDPRYLEPYNRGTQAVPARIARLNRLTASSPDDNVTRLNTLVNDRLTELRDSIAIRREQGAAAAVQFVLRDRGRQNMEQIRDICSAILSRADSGRMAAQAETLAATRGALLVSTAGSLLLVALLLAGYFAINNAARAREEALLESRRARDFLDTTLRSIGDAVISTDAEARVVFANKVALSLLRATEEQVKGKHLDDVFRVVNEYTRGKVESPATRVLREGRVAGFANRTVLIALDGSEIPIDDSGAPLRGENGPIQGTVLVFRDATERRRAEANNRLLASIVESSEDAIMSEDLHGVITSWNGGAERMFGYAAKEVVGQPVSVIIPPERSNEMHEILIRARDGERIEHYETERLAKDGQRIDVSLSISPLRDANGHITGASRIARDIRGHKQAVQALRESEERYRASFSNAAVGIAHVARDGRWLQFNDAVCRITGYSREELIGKTFTDITHPDDIAAGWEMAQRLWSGEIRTGILEKRYVRKDGAIVWAGLTVSLIRNASAGQPEKPPYFVTVIEDITERKEAEEAVRQSAEELRALAAELRASNEELVQSNRELRATKEQLQLVANTMAAAVARCSRDFRFIWVSRSFAAWMGKPLREIAKRPIRDVIGDEGFEAILPHMERVLTGRRVEFTALVNFIGPGERWIRSVYVPTYSNGQEVDGWIAVVTDITEETRAAEKLRAADERIRALVAKSSDGVVLLDEQARVLFAGAPILGYPLDEYADRGVMELVHPEDRRVATEKFAVLLRNPGLTVTLRVRARNKDGEWRWMEATSRNLLQEPAVRGIVVNYRDVTEQQQTEQSLRDQAQLLDLTQDAIMALRWDDRIEFWNRGAEECYGWNRQEAIGRVAGDLLKTEFPEPRESIRQKVLEHGRWHGELVHTRRDSARITVASQWALRNGPGGVHGYLEINTDITERKRAEEQLRQKQRLEGLGILAGGIAHDFNNLLVGILGNASLALDMLKPSEPARERIGDLITASERAADLTHQLLAYAGKEQLVTHPTDLTALVRELAALLHTSIPKNVQLALDLQEPLPRVNADRTQIRQVIMNLVINAAEAIPQNKPGTVRITTAGRKPTPEDRAHALTPLPQTQNTWVTLTVSDTGQGMTPEIRSRIFDPFFTTKFTGRGLGLSAVLGIVKAHQGTITLKTAPGSGTTFTLLLPATESAEVLPDVPALPEPGRGSGTILVVDDEPAVRSVAQIALEENGYRVLLAEDGQQAIDMLKAHPEVAVIVLDLAMPVMPGDEAAPRLRSLRPAVPIILSSGCAEAEAREQFRDSGITSFLQKPYRVTTLLEKLSLTLGSRQES